MTDGPGPVGPLGEEEMRRAMGLDPATPAPPARTHDPQRQPSGVNWSPAAEAMQSTDMRRAMGLPLQAPTKKENR